MLGCVCVRDERECWDVCVCVCVCEGREGVFRKSVCEG